MLLKFSKYCVETLNLEILITVFNIFHNYTFKKVTKSYKSNIINYLNNNVSFTELEWLKMTIKWRNFGSNVFHN